MFNGLDNLVLVLAGLSTSIDYVSLRVLDEIARADKVLIEPYTSIAIGLGYDRLRRMVLGELVYVTRKDLEEDYEWIIEEAKEKRILILIAGDPLIATTHVALLIEARRRGVDVEIVPGISGIHASMTMSGLQIYRFGRIVTLTYPEKDYKPYTTIEVIRRNLEFGLHTLVLLDIRFDEGRAMSIREAVDIILELEEEYCRQNKCTPTLRRVIGVGVARAGSREAKVQADILPRLRSYDYPPPPHSLIIVAEPHPVELEALIELANLPLPSIKESMYSKILKYTSYSSSSSDKPAT